MTVIPQFSPCVFTQLKDLSKHWAIFLAMYIQFSSFNALFLDCLKTHSVKYQVYVKFWLFLNSLVPHKHPECKRGQLYSSRRAGKQVKVIDKKHFPLCWQVFKKRFLDRWRVLKSFLINMLTLGTVTLLGWWWSLLFPSLMAMVRRGDLEYHISFFQV